VDFLMNMGPAAPAIREASPEARAKAMQAIREAIAPFRQESGVRMASATWIVTASSP
jgi:hypothetical protein